MGGANEKPVKQNWSSDKKLPFAGGDTQYEQNIEGLKKYKDILTTGKQDISLSEMISPYYGGEEQLASEIEAAKQYASDPARKKPYPEFGLQMDYEKIKQKLPVSSSPNLSSGYFPETQSVQIQSPQSSFIDIGKTLNLSKSDSPEDKKSFEKFLNKNVYTKKNLEFQMENPVTDFLGTLEHEVGHHSTMPKPEVIGTKIGISGTHISKPEELSNQLGKIQREAFYLYGKRFTPETLEDFMEQQKSLPEEERFQNFSPDTQRGLREIYNSRDLPTYPKTFRSLWDTAKEAIPEFVGNTKKSSNAIDEGLDKQEKLI